jgi:hypothetical protein
LPHADVKLWKINYFLLGLTCMQEEVVEDGDGYTVLKRKLHWCFCKYLERNFTLEMLVN